MIGLVCLSYACDGCVCDSSLVGRLTVKLTINEENPKVLLTVFKGNIETRDTILSNYISKESVSYEDFEPGHTYSATARYVQDGKNIIAVDGKKMRIKSDLCDDCESVGNIRLNLRLK